MNHWPFWLGGLALASIALAHWFLLKKTFAVSGRLTALVNRARAGAPEDTEAMTPEEMAEALRELTAAEFGPLAAETSVEPTKGATPAVREPESNALHLVFLASILVGGLISALAAGTFHPSFHLEGLAFARLLPGAFGSVALLLGGLMVGFGTRMAGGCTSGHGLSGTSRLQPGSLLATAAFFGAAVVTSFALGWIR